MNKYTRKILWMISILSLFGTTISYFYLPEQIPIHWNVNWEVDNLADKNMIFLLGALPILLIIMFRYLPKFDPRRYNYSKHGKAYEYIEIATVLLMIIMNWITIGVSLNININEKLILPLALGVLFLVIGNYMPRLKSNYFFGIKNPWTLSSDVVWRKTHKMGGYIFIIIGVLMIIMGIIQNKLMNNLTFLALIVGIIWLYIYSYLIYKDIIGNKDEQ
ncbi:MAG: putative rane protein [Anaerocolumna sp.]|nr:putative rane protein [Anaerocolumna sp.]